MVHLRVLCYHPITFNTSTSIVWVTYATSESSIQLVCFQLSNHPSPNHLMVVLLKVPSQMSTLSISWKVLILTHPLMSISKEYSNWVCLHFRHSHDITQSYSKQCHFHPFHSDIGFHGVNTKTYGPSLSLENHYKSPLLITVQQIDLWDICQVCLLLICCFNFNFNVL